MAVCLQVQELVRHLMQELGLAVLPELALPEFQVQKLALEELGLVREPVLEQVLAQLGLAVPHLLAEFLLAQFLLELPQASHHSQALSGLHLIQDLIVKLAH